MYGKVEISPMRSDTGLSTRLAALATLSSGAASPWVNYTTLLTRLQEGDDPFDGHEVLFIGQPEPWGDYEPLPMGQWPAILAAPSFRNQLHSVPQSKFLPSADFSRGIDSQWAWLHKQQPFRYSPGLVTSISARGGSHQGFDVTWEQHGGSTHQVHAANVDVCGGLARRDASVKRGRRFFTVLPAVAPRDRRVVLGQAATPAALVKRLRLSVGVHRRMVRRARARQQQSGTWASDKDVNPAFVSSGRNDWLAAGKSQPCSPGPHDHCHLQRCPKLARLAFRGVSRRGFPTRRWQYCRCRIRAEGHCSHGLPRRLATPIPAVHTKIRSSHSCARSRNPLQAPCNHAPAARSSGRPTRGPPDLSDSFPKIRSNTSS